MRIGVISDTHIPDCAPGIPEVVLEAFKEVDMVIHAGDLVSTEVLEQLRAVCKDIRAVCGNMDPHDIKKGLTEKMIIPAGKYRIGVMHGSGHSSKVIDSVAEEFKKDRVDLIIFGHSHCALNEKRGGIIYYNPGSPTDKVFAPYKSYGIIEINDKIEARIIKI